MKYVRPTLIDNITRILTLPCHLNGAVYIEMAAEALVRFGIDVASPDPKEVYHHVAGEPLIHSIRQGVKDLGETLGQEETPVRRALGSLLGWEDKAVWWYFLFQAGKDALLDATSNAIQMEPCLSGRGLGSGTNWISAIRDDGTWASQDFQFPSGSKYYPVNPSFVRLDASNNYTGIVACSAKFKALPDIPIGVASRITFYPDDNSGNFVLDQFSNATSSGAPTQRTNHVFAKYQAPQGRAGFLSCEFSYSGDPLPTHQAFLADGSTCFLSGAG